MGGVGQFFQSALDNILTKLGIAKIVSAVPDESKTERWINPNYKPATPTVTPTPTRSMNQYFDRTAQAQEPSVQAPTPTPALPLDEEKRRIRQGFSDWSNVPQDQLTQKIPITKDIDLMANIAEQYGLPYWLFPVLSIAESSGGQNTKTPTNPFNWGVRSGYAPPTLEETLRKMAESFTDRPSVGTDYANKYQIPLKEGRFQDFFQGYEPPSQNPNYWSSVQKLMNYFPND